MREKSKSKTLTMYPSVSKKLEKIASYYCKSQSEVIEILIEKEFEKVEDIKKNSLELNRNLVIELFASRYQISKKELEYLKQELKDIIIYSGDELILADHNKQVLLYNKNREMKHICFLRKEDIL